HEEFTNPSHREEEQPKNGNAAKGDVKVAIAAKQSGMEHMPAVQWQNRKEIESIDQQEEKGRLRQGGMMRYQTYNAEHCTEQNARDWAGQGDERLFPAGHIPVLASHSGAKERDKKHPQIAVSEDFHGHPVS